MKKSFKKLTSEITSLEENKQEVLRGGFSSFSLSSIDPEDKNKKSDCSNNNYASGCHC